MHQKLFSITQSLRFPSICTLCNQFHKNRLAVCDFCISLLEPLGTACQHCAHPLPDDLYLVCGQCIKNPPHFDRTISAYKFVDPIRGLLHQFKYHNGLFLGAFFSELILNAYYKSPIRPQCLIPVPMHPKRLRLRGFNQAAILTQLIARTLKLPYDLTSCQKKVNTTPQASLDGEQRQKNLRKTFYIKPLPYDHVAVIDDLLTTGSTANELAVTLKNSGIKRVDIWCCARATGKNY